MTTKLRLSGFLFLSTFLCVTQVMGSSLQKLPDFRQIVREHSSAVVKIIVEQSPSQNNGGQPRQEQIPEELRRFFEFRGIDAADLPMLKLADNDDLEVGEWVLAIGSPFGLDYSVTAGIVSAKGRSLPTEQNENYVPFIQTDVAINPGNSGGPLFNLDGEVVGVNSQIFTRSGGSIGLSFAIPSSVASNVIKQLKKNGRVTRGWLGVTIQDVDKTLAQSFGLKRAGGALIADMSDDGPAAKAGLRSGDIIVKFDGKPIPTSADLPHVVGLVAPGSTVEVELVRDKKSQSISVKVGGLESDDSYTLSAGDADEHRGGRLGMEVESLSPDSLEHLGISGGVVVRRVESGSIASESGIRVDDVITLIDTSPIQSVETFERAVDTLKDRGSVPLRLIRQGSSLFIALKLSD